ncbi:MAG TPA: CapA family protein [Gemmatimonadaceae bacterium]
MPLTLFLSGDVMTGRGVDQVLPHRCPPRLYEPVVTSALDYVALAERASGPIARPVTWDYPWGDALEVLERMRPDARIINLETSITTSERAAPKTVNYRMHPRNVPVLSAARVDCCVLANNHVLDWGREGLLETLDTLREAGVRVAGAGRDRREATAPAEIGTGAGEPGRGRGRVLVYALGAIDSGIPPEWEAGATTPGVWVLPDFSDRTVSDIARRVALEKRAGDLVVASIHWGPNWGFDIPPDHRRFAHALVDDAGVDVVHGHSSHHPMAVEVHGGRPIFYGCGDLLNDYEGIPGYEQFRDDLVLMYFPTLDLPSGALLRLSMIPLQIRNFRLRHATRGDRVWLRDTMDRECRRFGHRVVDRDGALALEW